MLTLLWLALVFVSVAFVSVILLTVILLVATATAQDKDDLKSLRADNSLPFYMGVITGITSAYIATYLAICPRPVSGAMVLAVVDSSDRLYDDRPPTVAVLNALTYLGCEVDADYLVRRFNETKAK